MPLRFYRRFRAGPFRMNVSKRGVSYSVGGKGAWITAGRNRVRTTIGLPGSGVYWTEQRRLPANNASVRRQSGHPMLRPALWIIGGFLTIIALGFMGALLYR